MFTGLIERVGELMRIESRGEGAILTIRSPGWTDPLVVGESVAVEGVCLTVTGGTGVQFSCDVLKETLTRTTLGQKKAGAPMNLERALRADSRLGGHFVSGHVDGTGRIERIGRAGPDWALDIEAEPELMAGLVFKGSIAVNGVSLTLTRVEASGFSVHLIPHTWEQTTLHELKPGNRVNLETDMLGKYVKAFLDKGLTSGKPGGLTWEKLHDAGMTE